MEVRHFGSRRRWMAVNFTKLVAGVAGAAWLALSAGAAVAAEGGSSFYLPGQRGQGAGILPPEGVFAVLGDFKGRVTALGPTVSANFQLGQVPVATTLRYLHEFNVRNRLEGDVGWLTISIPLWVPDPES